MEPTRILTIKFKNRIYDDEVPLLRGAVIDSFENKEINILFHNHQIDKLRYSYPLIQYKCINNHAAIVCINEGADAIGEYFSACNFTNCRLGNREIILEIDSLKGNKVFIKIGETIHQYKIRRWLPLNQENYQEYKRLEVLTEKIAFLERMLIGNILSFNKGIGLHIEEKIVCQITGYIEPEPITYKGVKLMSFDIGFRSNIELPDYIGLGKNASINYGIITRLD